MKSKQEHIEERKARISLARLIRECIASKNCAEEAIDKDILAQKIVDMCVRHEEEIEY